MRRIREKQLTEREWLKGFMFGSDGKFYIVVDTIFFNGHELNEDDFYYTKEEYRKKFITKV